MMPEYDEFYALECIRNIDFTAKVIMITAAKTTETEKRLKQLSSTVIVYKPYDINEVIDMIKLVYENHEINTESKLESFIPNI